MSLEDVLDFSKDNLYMLFCIARSKNNEGVTAKQQVVIREPVRSLESFPHKIAKIKAAAELRDLKFYLYISVNARDKIKGYINFKQKMTEYEIQMMFGHHESENQFSRLHKVWYSSLMQTNARATKYFLLDVDTKDELILEEIKRRVKQFKFKDYIAEIKYIGPTRNGFHIISTPFDKRILNGIPDVSVNKDGLLYLGSIGFGEENDIVNHSTSLTSSVQ